MIFSILKTGSNPVDIYRFQSHNLPSNVPSLPKLTNCKLCLNFDDTRNHDKHADTEVSHGQRYQELVGSHGSRPLLENIYIIVIYRIVLKIDFRGYKNKKKIIERLILYFLF